MTDQRPQRRGSGFPSAVGLAVVVLVCCAGPVLVAAGALGAVGAALRNPLLIAAAGVLVVAVLAMMLSRAARRLPRRPDRD